MSLMPLLIVALLIWAGVFVFIVGVEGRVRKLEKRIADAQAAEATTAAALAAQAALVAQKELGQ